MFGSWLGAKALRSGLAWLGLGKNADHVQLGDKTHKRTASPETNLNATFADEAYVLPADRRHTIGDYYYDKGLSNDENAIYVNKKGRVIHSIRGTELKRGVGQAIKDVGGTWGAIATGNFTDTSRHKRNDAKAQEVFKKYGQHVFYTGHSLGGSSAYALANKYNKRSQTFNLGHGLSSSAEIAYSKECKKDPSQPRCQQIHSRVGRDIVSFFPTLVGRTEQIDRPNASNLTGVHELSNWNINANPNKYRSESKSTPRKALPPPAPLPKPKVTKLPTRRPIKKYRSNRF